MKYQMHPACAKWPLIPEDELRNLADDIKLNGLIEPATLTKDGLMLDGRSREMACELAGVELHTTIYEGDDEIGFVISKNLRRRHLPLAELAMIGAELATLKHGGERRGIKLSQECLKNSSMSKSAKAVAEQLGIGVASVMDAKTIKEHGTAEVIDLVKQGDVGMRDAAAYTRNTDKSEQKADATEIRRKGGAINKGQAKGKKAKPAKTAKPKTAPQPLPTLLNLTKLDLGDETKLDPKQQVHLYPAIVASLLQDSRNLGDVESKIIYCAGSAFDPESVKATIRRLTDYVPIPGKKNGEQTNFAAKARASIKNMTQHIDKAIENLQAIRSLITDEKTASPETSPSPNGTKPSLHLPLITTAPMS